MLINKISKGLYLRFLSRCRVVHLSENLGRRFYSDFRRKGFQACQCFFGKKMHSKMIISLFFFFEINLPVKYAYRSRVQEITFIWKSRTDSISNMFRVLTFWLFIFCKLKGGMVSLRCGSRKPVDSFCSMPTIGRLKAIFLSQQFYSCLGGNVQKTLVT